MEYDRVRLILFIICTLTLQYMLNYYNVSYHFYADDTHIGELAVYVDYSISVLTRTNEKKKILIRDST